MCVYDLVSCVEEVLSWPPWSYTTIPIQALYPVWRGRCWADPPDLIPLSLYSIQALYPVWWRQVLSWPSPLILYHYHYTGSVSSVEEAGAELTPSRSKSRLSLSDISPSRVSFLPRFLRSSFSRLLHREKEGFIYSEMGKRSVNSSFLLTQFSVMWNQTKPNHQKCVLHSFCYID